MSSDRAPRFAIVASALSSDARQAPTLARQAGFAGLLFDAYFSSLNIPELSATGRREFRHELSSQDRELVGLRVDLGTKGFGSGADVDRLLSQMAKVMEAAASLASPLVCVEAGPMPEPPRMKKSRPVVTQEQAGALLLPVFAAPVVEVLEPEYVPTPAELAFTAQVDRAMAEVGVLADRYNVATAFRSELSSFAALERTLIAARCPWFGIDLDPVAILRDTWDRDEIFSRLGNLIHHVRGRDAVCGTDRRTKPMPIGRGDTKWDELLSSLEGAAYHGWITLDPIELPDRLAAANAGLKYLRLHV